jgi:predicted peroxiredoxin
MGARVGICFVLQAPRLLKRGMAENLVAKPGGRTIREFINEALADGVTFYVCDAALALCDMTPEDLIEEVDDLVGPSFLITQGLDSDLVLSF